MSEIAQLFTAEQVKHLTEVQKQRLAKVDGPEILHAIELADKIAAVRPSK